MTKDGFYQVMRLLCVVALLWASCSGVTVNGRHYSATCGKPEQVQP